MTPSQIIDLCFRNITLFFVMKSRVGVMETLEAHDLQLRVRIPHPQQKLTLKQKKWLILLYFPMNLLIDLDFG